MNRRDLAIAVALLLGAAVPVAAQSSIQLAFKDGRVSLIAHEAAIQEVLVEWERLGQVTIVHGERATGWITCDLRDVPEQQAIETVLRNVAGYIIERRPAGVAAASTFDRISILAATFPDASASVGSSPVSLATSLNQSEDTADDTAPQDPFNTP